MRCWPRSTARCRRACAALAFVLRCAALALGVVGAAPTFCHLCHPFLEAALPPPAPRLTHPPPPRCARPACAGGADAPQARLHLHPLQLWHHAAPRLCARARARGAAAADVGAGCARGAAAARVGMQAGMQACTRVGSHRPPACTTHHHDPPAAPPPPPRAAAAQLDASVAATAAFLNQAVKPVLVCGARMRSPRARAAMVKLAEASGACAYVCLQAGAWLAGLCSGAASMWGGAAQRAGVPPQLLQRRCRPQRLPPCPPACLPAAAAAAAGMPVAVMMNAKGLFPEDHPNFIGGCQAGARLAPGWRAGARIGGRRGPQRHARPQPAW